MIREWKSGEGKGQESRNDRSRRRNANAKGAIKVMVTDKRQWVAKAEKGGTIDTRKGSTKGQDSGVDGRSRTWISPGPHDVDMRDAVLTVSPNSLYRGALVPTMPATRGPLLSPIRRSTSLERGPRSPSSAFRSAGIALIMSNADVTRHTPPSKTHDNQ